MVVFGLGGIGLNVVQGAIGLVMTIAAAVSTTAFGFIAQDMAHWVAFLGMAAVAAAGGLVVWFHVKETRPATYID